MTPAAPQDPTPDYERLAELAENLATEIAGSEPDWCTLAADAEELASGLRILCEAGD